MRRQYSRDEVEKTRLRQRSECYHRDPEQRPVHEDRPSVRFTRTEEVADFLAAEREAKKIRDLENIERRRAEAANRFPQHDGDLLPLPKNRENRKNLSGAGFDPVTLRYDRNSKGEELRYKDQLIGFREKVRANYLALKSHSGFNVITGEQTIELKMPNFEFKN